MLLNIKVMHPQQAERIYTKTRPKAYRSGQFAIFEKTLDFSRLRNEIRKRSHVPRERNKFIIYIQVQISIASLKYNLSNVSKLSSRLLEVSKEIQHRRRQRQRERLKFKNLNAWSQANSAASATPTFHLSIQQSVFNSPYLLQNCSYRSNCSVLRQHCRMRTRQNKGKTVIIISRDVFPALPLSLLKLPSTFFFNF